MKRQKLITALAELWDWNNPEIGDLLQHDLQAEKEAPSWSLYPDATEELAFFHFGHETLDLLTNRQDEDDDFEDDFEDDDDFDEDLDFDDEDFDEEDDLDWDNLDDEDDFDLEDFDLEDDNEDEEEDYDDED
jgi:hypothetical protein